MLLPLLTFLCRKSCHENWVPGTTGKLRFSLTAPGPMTC